MLHYSPASGLLWQVVHSGFLELSCCKYLAAAAVNRAHKSEPKQLLTGGKTLSRAERNYGNSIHLLYLKK